MKTLIYQVYVGAQSNLYDHCTASVKAYADSIGADYILQTEPILKIRPNPFTTNRSKEAVERLGYLPIYEKENAFDYLDRYDMIAIIDSDVWIRPGSPSIFKEIKPYTEMAAVLEYMMPLTPEYQRKIHNYSIMQYRALGDKMKNQLPDGSYEFCNMGVMVITSRLRDRLHGLTAKEFLTQPRFQGFIDGDGAWKWSTDQTLLNFWMQYETQWQPLSWEWNGLYSANTRIKECHFVHFFLKDKLPNRGENVKELMKNV
jgi:hypothetical protein